MRKEMRLFDERNPPNAGLTRKILLLREKLILELFRYRLRRIKVGSVEWHVLQERLSHGSAVGLDMKKRNTFYMSTLPECGRALYVQPGVIIYYPQNVKFGFNVFINRHVYFTAPAEIRIGDNVLIGPYSVLNSGSHLYSDSYRLIRDQGHRVGPIIIENDVWIGAHVCILPDTMISEGAVVAANAVVTKPVSPYTVVAGVPARVIGRRE